MVVDYKVMSEAFEGTVKVEIPKYPQRIRFYKEMNFVFEKNEEGKNVISMNSDNMGRNAEAFASMIEKAAPFIKEVNIKSKSEQKEYKSYDELMDDYRCDNIVNEIASFVFSGGSLGGTYGQS